MKKTKKALASLAIASMAMTMVPFNAFAAGTVPERLAGQTAEQTAVAIAEQTGWTGTAILASSESYGAADALTAGPLAAYLKAPILLQGAGAVLNPYTKAELTKLSVKKVYVTSGTAVISQAVLNELVAMGITVEPLGGNDRFDTSVNIAKKMIELGAPVTKVAVAYGWKNEDALSIAAIGAAANQPILLTEKTGLSASAKAFLAANPKIVTSDVIGGTGVIDAAVLAQLPSPTRHFGNTAYDTNSQVIQDFAAALTFENIFVASAVTAIDALSGAPLASVTKSPIVLTNGVDVPSVATFVYSKSTASTVVTALGGSAVVPEAVRVGIAKGELPSVPGELAITMVSALNDTNQFLKIEFNKVASGIQASDIVIKDAKKGDLYGVKAATLASDGKSVTVELYEAQEDEDILQENTEYTITVTANGQILTGTFYDSAFTESRVVDINVGDDEFVVVDDDDASKKTITVTKDVKFDYQAAMGELVRVWYNDDNELLKYEIVDKSSLTDAIEITDNDEIKLLDADKKYDTTDEEYNDKDDETKFAFYVDGERVDEDGIIPDEYVDKKYNFAKVGLDKSGDVEFISAYALNDFLIVDSIDEDEIVGIDGDGTSGSFDAEDTTVIKDGKVVALADLEKGDVLFYSEDADDEDGFAEVPNNTVTGEIDEVYADAIEVDGESYKYIADEDVVDDFGGISYATAVYLNEDEETEQVDSDAAEELQAAGEVTLYLDRAGNLAYISGETAEVDSNSLTAVLTDNIDVDSAYGKQSVQIEALVENGDEELYDITLEDLDSISVNGEEYDIDNDDTDATNDDYVVEVDANNVLSIYDSVDGDKLADTDVDLDTVEGHVIKVVLTDDGDVKELEFFEANDTDEGTDILTDGDLEPGDDYFDGDGAGAKKLKDSTVVYDATSVDDGDYDADDITITTWGKYDGSDIDNARIIYNDDNEVEALVIIETSSSSDVYEEAVITKVLRNTDDEIVSITAYINGELVTVQADDITGFDSSSDLQKGDVAILEFDENNLELVQGIQAASKKGTEFNARVKTATAVIADSDVNVGSKEVKIDGTTYKLSDDGEVIDASDLNDISVEGLADLRGEKNVTFVLDENTGKFVKYFVYGLKTVIVPPVDTTAPTATVTTATVTIGTAVTTVKSDEAGTAYLVLDSANLTTKATLEAEVAAAKATKVTVTAGTATSIATTGLVAGTYKVVAVDAAGNVSAESAGTITLTAPAEVLPTATLVAEASELLGNKIIRVTLDAADLTKYNVTVDGTALQLNATKDQFVGLLETSKSTAELQALTVVTKI